MTTSIKCSLDCCKINLVVILDKDLGSLCDKKKKEADDGPADNGPTEEVKN